jgi:anti-anti-sigma regulatory factor
MAPGGTDTGRGLNKLKGRLARGEGFTVVRLDGVIDEHNELASYTERIGSGEALFIDLGGVKRLNSVGVRDWVNWLRALKPKFARIVLFDCPPPVMNEVNFVKNFADGAHITTFSVPLFCARCNKEENRLLESAPLKSNGRKLPSFACEQASCENTIDDDEDSYLAFLDGLPDHPDPGRLLQLTAFARAAASTGAPIDGAPAGGNGAHGRSEPATRPPLQIGSAGVEALTSAAPLKSVSAPVPVPERTEASRGDWPFMAAMAAMVAVLGVLLYLILTME